MMIRRPRPRVNSAVQPICLMMSPAEAPFWEFSLDTRLSAGSEHKTASAGQHEQQGAHCQVIIIQTSYRHNMKTVGSQSLTQNQGARKARDKPPRNK